MGKLMLVSGIPGAGKSTWIKAHMNWFDEYVSRDEIRFGLLGPDDDYFDKENEVFALYIAAIEKALKAGKTVWADATHLNIKARLKVLHAIFPKPTDIDVVDFQIPLEIALERNEGREGLARVPRGQIRRMYFSRDEIEFHEGEFTYGTIYTVDENGKLTMRKEMK